MFLCVCVCVVSTASDQVVVEDVGEKFFRKFFIDRLGMCVEKCEESCFFWIELAKE